MKRIIFVILLVLLMGCGKKKVLGDCEQLEIYMHTGALRSCQNVFDPNDIDKEMKSICLEKMFNSTEYQQYKSMECNTIGLKSTKEQFACVQNCVMECCEILEE